MIVLLQSEQVLDELILLYGILSHVSFIFKKTILVCFNILSSATPRRLLVTTSPGKSPKLLFNRTPGKPDVGVATPNTLAKKASTVAGSLKSQNQKVGEANKFRLCGR